MTSNVCCPECNQEATVVDRFVLSSTDGPVEHLRIECVERHFFLMPADRLVAYPAPEGLQAAS